MADKNTLKGYFNTGNIPNQSQYADLIDSNLNLQETGTQVLVGTLSSSFLEVTNHITASGNISSSGGFIGDITTIRNVTNAEFHPVFVDSANGELTPETLYTSNSSLTYNPSTNAMTLGQITASGNISSSGAVYANAFYGDGSGLTNAPSTYTNITASGNISASGNIIASTLDTGQGANKLYDMNQNVKTTSAVTFTTVNTGQGATEVHLMNQHVQTTNSPTFAGLTLTKVDYETLDLGSTTIKVIDGGSAGQLLVRSVPSIEAGASSATYTLTTDRILATSVIIISTSALITCNATNIANGSCGITFHNPTLIDFSSGTVTINIAIL